MILLIGGIKNSMRINQERHILNLTIKQVMVILILSLNIPLLCMPTPITPAAYPPIYLPIYAE